MRGAGSGEGIEIRRLGAGAEGPVRVSDPYAMTPLPASFP